MINIYDIVFAFFVLINILCTVVVFVLSSSKKSIFHSSYREEKKRDRSHEIHWPFSKATQSHLNFCMKEKEYIYRKSPDRLLKHLEIYNNSMHAKSTSIIDAFDIADIENYYNSTKIAPSLSGEITTRIFGRVKNVCDFGKITRLNYDMISFDFCKKEDLYKHQLYFLKNSCKDEFIGLNETAQIIKSISESSDNFYSIIFNSLDSFYTYESNTPIILKNNTIYTISYDDTMRLGLFNKNVQNYDAALKCFVKAAMNNNCDAFYELGYLYEKGLGVSKDVEKAFKFYLISDKCGSFKAKARILLYCFNEHPIAFDKKAECFPEVADRYTHKRFLLKKPKKTFP